MKTLANKIFNLQYASAKVHINTEQFKELPDLLINLLYPQRKTYTASTPEDIERELLNLEKRLSQFLETIRLGDELCCFNKDAIITEFFNQIESLAMTLNKDIEAMFQGDPAANSREEIILCYPGFYALCIYRMAHLFFKMNVPYLPRILSELAHEKTGIDIHPGAILGESIFIDHGTGIVIGETAVIGNHVKIYQGVTLGALSVDKKLKHTKRHPTIEDGVILYSHSTILGGATVIGKNSIIGGNSWITKSVAEKTKVPGNSSLI